QAGLHRAVAVAVALTGAAAKDLESETRVALGTHTLVRPRGAGPRDRNRAAVEFGEIRGGLLVRGDGHGQRIDSRFRWQAPRNRPGEVLLVLGVGLVGLPGELIRAAIHNRPMHPLHVEVVLD